MRWITEREYKEEFGAFLRKVVTDLLHEGGLSWAIKEGAVEVLASAAALEVTYPPECRVAVERCLRRDLYLRDEAFIIGPVAGWNLESLLALTPARLEREFGASLRDSETVVR